ncbi:MAG: thiamine diphosphokinase [Clostridia bacterium]|nr:thiamine diphosphokinase [Clostridia bacterium]
MKTCYIIGAGEVFDLPTPSDDDLVIAADGGYAVLTRHGVRCDLLIGDFDSLPSVPEGVDILRYPIEKDDTDTFLAYREGVRRGYECFVIYGGTGGLEDHTYANLCLLHYAALHGHRATLIGEHNVSRVIVSSSVTLPYSRGNRVSVFAVGGEARGVSIRGLKYSVEDATLTPDFPLGVSNHFTDSDGFVEVRDGALLVMVEK